MEDSHIKRLPNEFWTDYLVRRLGYEGYEVKDFSYANISGDNEENESWIFLENEIKTSKGEVRINRMLNANKNIFTASRNDLENLSMTLANEYFLINERDKGQEHAYRDFGFIIEDDVKATIQEHSSENRVPNFPGRNSWSNTPLIEKYKGHKGVFYPKGLVDDVVKYIQLVGTPDKPVKVKQPKRSYSNGPGLGLSLEQTYEIPENDEGDLQ